MIIRDVNGNLHVINRNDCKNDTTYYQKIVTIKKEYNLLLQNYYHQHKQVMQIYRVEHV